VPSLNFPSATGPVQGTTARSPWSIRRTSSIDTCWPDGPGTSMYMTGHSRDLLTSAATASPQVLAEDRFTARLTPEREIITVSSNPPRPATAELAGSRAGSQLRSAIARTLGDELASGTPLYLLLDDIAGASLVAHWGAMQWAPEPESAGELVEPRVESMLGVCWGFSPDSPVIKGEPGGRQSHHRKVAPLDVTPDTWAWHVLPEQHGPAARRARRIDVHFAGDLILAETHFQDSAPLRDGTRLAVHEYLVQLTIDRQTHVIQSITADPRILPFGYCPGAVHNIGLLVGTKVGALRQTVIDLFAKTAGCTHLNDTMRSLAEVPQLSAALAAAIQFDAQSRI